MACALRAVTSTDGMTADVYPFEMAFLTRVAGRIVNEVRGINRVTYDITSKPPGTGVNPPPATTRYRPPSCNDKARAAPVTASTAAPRTSGL